MSKKYNFAYIWALCHFVFASILSVETSVNVIDSEKGVNMGMQICRSGPFFAICVIRHCLCLTLKP